MSLAGAPSMDDGSNEAEQQFDFSEYTVMVDQLPIANEEKKARAKKILLGLSQEDAAILMSCKMQTDITMARFSSSVAQLLDDVTKPESRELLQAMSFFIAKRATSRLKDRQTLGEGVRTEAGQALADGRPLEVVTPKPVFAVAFSIVNGNQISADPRKIDEQLLPRWKQEARFSPAYAVLTGEKEGAQWKVHVNPAHRKAAWLYQVLTPEAVADYCKQIAPEDWR
ncbi:hypothetical protein KKA95_02840 [Patescibacteria group bacterium]|nr:hypothetical protein [Patescibacteria group bacterium]